VVTPFAVQPELPIWLLGPRVAEVARARGLSHVSGPDETPEQAASAWAATAAALGPGACRLRRPALRALQTDSAGSFDAAALVAALLDERRLWGLDTVVLRLPAALDQRARERAMRALATRVRPRVVLDALPHGIEEHWDDALAQSLQDD
jgi:hypothetical protein